MMENYETLISLGHEVIDPDVLSRIQQEETSHVWDPQESGEGEATPSCTDASSEDGSPDVSISSPDPGLLEPFVVPAQSPAAPNSSPPGLSSLPVSPVSPHGPAGLPALGPWAIGEGDSPVPLPSDVHEEIPVGWGGPEGSALGQTSPASLPEPGSETAGGSVLIEILHSVRDLRAGLGSLVAKLRRLSSALERIASAQEKRASRK
ncbi:U1 small nuclear ribonucleoprotein C-like [Rhinatrema bivittatum]|uniref:U1 small nuclear ribonucleoprotein C-like n=1 Tax=Rhinatrema bivittatum TaxID=194408 RepID=UPI00112C40C8|nr:U1 small nuclear ribonucleoprotein C-like [Rhinatrema bivittatum]